MRRFKFHLIITAIITFSLGIAITAFLTLDFSKVSSHLWKKLDSAKVIYNGQSSPNSSVYRSGDGNLLVISDQQPYQSYYIVFPSLNDVGTPNASNFYFLPKYIYSRDVPPPFAMMSPVKHDRYAELVMGPNSAEFNATVEGRVLITW